MNKDRADVFHARRKRYGLTAARLLVESKHVKFERHIETVGPDQSAVDLLSEATRLPKAAIKQSMNKGAVWLTRSSTTQRIRRADKALRTGDLLHLYYDENVLQQKPAAATLIADEGRYSIWSKPYGMLSQGSKWGDHCTINRWVEKRLQPQRPAFVTHRLDRAATGLMIIAHEKKVAAYFAEQFRLRKVAKSYQAIVHGRFPDNETIEAPIGDKPALSHVSRIRYDAVTDESLLEVVIETGRKHQIRRHLAEAGFSIVGDRLFGDSRDQTGRNLCLSACRLSFHAPQDGERRTYELPQELRPTFFRPPASPKDGPGDT